MHKSSKLLSTTLVMLSLAALPAAATPHADLAYDVQESNHDKTSGWIVERLITLELGSQCWARVLDKNTAGMTKIASTARYIERFAKVLTGDEWSHIEQQGANNKDANRAIVDKMINDFKPKFHLTVRLEGDDCDASGSALWLKYVTTTVTALSSYPPKSGRITVTVNVTSKVKTLTAEANADGTAFTVTGPSGIEVVNWSGTIEKALKRISTKN